MVRIPQFAFRLSLSVFLVLTMTACTLMPSPVVAPASGQISPTSPEVITVADALGRQIAFQQPPRRIALTGKALFMVADAAYLFPEAGQRIVAIGRTGQMQVDFISILDPSYQDKIILQSDAGPEQIAAVQPDAVILKSTNVEKLGKPLESLGIPVVYVDFETPEQYQRDLRTLGQLFNNLPRAEELITFFHSHADRIADIVAGFKEEQKPRVLLMYYTDRDGTVAFNVPPLRWMQTLLVQRAGGRPVWQDVQLGNGWTKVSLEQIAAWDPDQIYVVTYTSKVSEVTANLKADPQWQMLRAVRQGQLYAFPGDFYSWDQPDTRWILGLTWLATKIHPASFQDLDIIQEARRFYHELYHLDDDAYDRHVRPNLFGDLP